MKTTKKPAMRRLARGLYIGGEKVSDEEDRKTVENMREKTNILLRNLNGASKRESEQSKDCDN
jgi:hypothetical protein